jgi:hypothetical protein
MTQTTGFARLPGGLRVAFAVVGAVRALVLRAWWVSHLVEDWRFDPLRHFVEGLAAGRMVVRYDRVGTGLSDRERPPGTFTPAFEDAAKPCRFCWPGALAASGQLGAAAAGQIRLAVVTDVSTAADEHVKVRHAWLRPDSSRPAYWDCRVTGPAGPAGPA